MIMKLSIRMFVIAMTFVFSSAYAQNLCPDNNHPHSIDLGLPDGTKWACCNVGANSPEEKGGYYAWGEPETKSYYGEKNYKYYNINSDNYIILGRDISGTRFDTASILWLEGWQMPTADQMITLINNCTSSWTLLNGMRGKIFEGPNGNAVFFPAAGGRDDDRKDQNIGFGCYWSSTQDPYYRGDAFGLYFYGDNMGISSFNSRFCGQSVRPVKK